MMLPMANKTKAILCSDLYQVKHPFRHPNVHDMWHQLKSCAQ